MISMMDKSWHYLGKYDTLKYHFLLRFTVCDVNTIPETLNVVKTQVKYLSEKHLEKRDYVKEHEWHTMAKLRRVFKY